MAELFMGSLSRLDTLLLTPGNIAVAAVLWERCTIKAAKRIFGQRKFTDEEFNRRKPEIQSEIARLFADLAPNPDLHRKHTVQLEIFVGHFEQVDALEALLEGYLLQAWTAFETMAGDLWEAALNEHPNVLSDLSGKLDKTLKGLTSRKLASVFTPKQQAHAKEGQDEEGKWIQLEKLKIYNYDVSRRMGTVLRDRFPMSVLPGIRQAYYRAFSQDNDEILAALNDPALDALSAMRNVVAHQNGRIDEDFRLKFRKRFAWVSELKELANLNIGDKIELTGNITRWLGDNTFKCGWGLLRAVDDWLVSHG
jgi:hypothetical protein